MSSQVVYRIVLGKKAVRTFLLIACVLAVSGVCASTIHFGSEIPYESRDASVGEEPGMWCSHPTDSEQLIGVTSAPATESKPGNFLRQNYIVRRSADGGRTWSEVLRTAGAPVEIDPACTYGVDGQVFVSAMAHSGTAFDGANVWRSSDDGRTWDGPQHIDHKRFFDRPFLSVDRGNTPFRGRLYLVAWGKSFVGDVLQGPDEMVVYTSDDGGVTFNPPATVPTKSDEGKWAVHPGEPVILPDGTFVISWTEVDMDIDFAAAKMLPSAGISTIKIARSIDGGRSFEPSIEVAKSKWRMESEGRDVTVSKFYPSIAVDRTKGPFDNSIYMAWADASEGRQQIVLSRSVDGGRTWTKPQVLSDSHNFDSSKPIQGPHNKMVVVRVNKEGVVGALFYAQTTPNPNVQFQPVFTVSLDGGLTWSSPEQVLESPTRYNEINLGWDCSRGAGSHETLQPIRCLFPSVTSVPNCLYGLTTDVAGNFRIFAFSNPSGRPTYTMRTAAIDGQVVRRNEVDTDVSVEIRTLSYDQDTQTVVVGAAILNTGSNELGLPIRLVVGGTGNNSYAEQRIEVLNSDSMRSTDGAWWDFESPSGRDVLAPNERSSPRLLKIRFKGQINSSLSSTQRMLLSLRTYETTH